jgi:5'-phosphate synthase pdxT subunit
VRQRVGVLALQGGFGLHLEVLRRLGVEGRTVRRPDELAACDALVLPGGESGTVRKLLARSGLDRAVAAFARRRPVLGTCAGCVLLAREVHEAGGVEPLGCLDLVVERNGYGRQLDSFEAAVDSDRAELDGHRVPFIRAPRIVAAGPEVEVLGRHGGEVVAVGVGSLWALTFHPEVPGEAAWHRAWLEAAG